MLSLLTWSMRYPSHHHCEDLDAIANRVTQAEKDIRGCLEAGAVRVSTDFTE